MLPALPWRYTPLSLRGLRSCRSSPGLFRAANAGWKMDALGSNVAALAARRAAGPHASGRNTTWGVKQAGGLK